MEPEVKPIHRVFAALIAAEPPRRTLEDVPEQDREAVRYVLDAEYSN